MSEAFSDGLISSAQWDQERPSAVAASEGDGVAEGGKAEALKEEEEEEEALARQRSKTFFD